ncbi:MFS transporter [Ramlibacter sp.]|uniref:MFS transporter n=1 Tax=Ramlibacter sp. TaxID=1917967 RepID=UPI003D0B14C1
MKAKIFYGWRMVGAGAFIQFLHAGLLQQAFGAYVAMLSQEKGWSKTALAGGAALQSVESALLGPLLGWTMDKFGARAMMQLGIVLFGMGFMLLSQIDTVAGFYVAMAVIAIGTSLSGYFPLTVTLVHWFRRQRARALSIMGLGMAFGGIAVPLVAWAMQVHGWRTTAFAAGVIAIVLGLPAVRVMRKTPAEMGLTPDGLPPVAESAEHAPGGAGHERQFTAAEALRTRAFWMISTGHSLALLVVSAVNVHAISHMKEGLGYSLSQASLVITIMLASQGAGMLVGAAVGDHWEKRKVAAACMIGHAAGLLMLTFAVHPLMLGAFAILHGVAWGLRGPFMQAIRADYFGVQAIGMIMGISAFVTAIGQVCGPMVAGAFADGSGHYRVAFTVLALVSALGSVMFFLAKKPT